MKKNVGIVILNYKKWEDTIDCLKSLYCSTYKNYNIFVVDNDSQNNSLQKIENWLNSKSRTFLFLDKSKIDRNAINMTYLIQSNYNGGYAAGNNIGIKLALQTMCEYILILNPDTTGEVDFLMQLVEKIEARNNIGMVGPKIVNEWGRMQYLCAKKRPSVNNYMIYTFLLRKFLGSKPLNPIFYNKDFYKGNIAKQVDIISGACMLLKCSILEEINLLDENTFLYMEELILHEKLRQLNYLTLYVPTSKVTHFQGSSTSILPPKLVRNAYLKSLLYYWKCIRKKNSLLVHFIVLNAYILQTFTLLRSKYVIKR